MTDQQLTLSLETPEHLPTHYDRALYHLAQAVRVDEVMSVRNEAEQLKLLGKQANDRTLIANAAELTMRAERRLGEMLGQAKEAGLMHKGGRPSKAGTPPGAEGVFTKVALADAGIDWKLSSKAQKLAKADPGLFERMIAEARIKIESGKAITVNPLKDISKSEKQLKRRIKEAQLAAKGKDLPKDVFQVIYADPEWKFETWSENGLDRGAENHYPTSDLAAIKARPVGTLAAKDCVLFMWVTAPFHAAGHGAAVMRFWGFEPKAEWIWNKVDQATGYWNRGQHEVLLVGVKGNVPAPAMGTQYPSVITSRPGAHSEKPGWAYELIEAYFPNLKKIELNARRRRPGWEAWGYEAPEDEDAELSAGAEEARQPDGAAEVATADPLRSAEGSAASDGGEGAADIAALPAHPFPVAAEGSGSTGGADVGGDGEALGPDEPAIAGAEGGLAAPAPLAQALAANEVIRAGYAQDLPISDIAAATGLSENAVRLRAGRMKLGDRDRQRRAVAESNRRRTYVEASP